MVVFRTHTLLRVATLRCIVAARQTGFRSDHYGRSTHDTFEDWPGALSGPAGVVLAHDDDTIDVFMQTRSKRIVIAALMLASACGARAEIVVHELGSTAANTLHSLSRNVLIGCIVLAIGIVAAAFISKKK